MIMMMAAVMACTATGDSIALGAGTALRCGQTQAVVGASSRVIARMPAPPAADVAVVSMGSNNPTDTRLASDMVTVRSRLTARAVVWIVPRDRRPGRVVLAVCRAMGDAMVDLADLPTADGVHPRSYGALARAIARARRC